MCKGPETEGMDELNSSEALKAPNVAKVSLAEKGGWQAMKLKH